MMVKKTSEQTAPRAAAASKASTPAKRAPAAAKLAPRKSAARKPAAEKVASVKPAAPKPETPHRATGAQLHFSINSAPAEAARTNGKEAPEVTDHSFAPTLDINAATERMRTLFDGKTMIDRTSRIAQEAAELAKGNVEAMVASSRIAAQNAGTISQEAAELGRKGFEGASEAMKGFAEAKSPAELLRLQGEYAKSYMETVIAESARLSETMVKLAGEAMEPVSSRFAVAAERAKTLASN